MQDSFIKFHREKLGLILVIILVLCITIWNMKKKQNAIIPFSHLHSDRADNSNLLKEQKDPATLIDQTTDLILPSPSSFKEEEEEVAVDRLQKIIQNEKSLLYVQNLNWLSHEAELKKQILELSMSELKKLVHRVLSIEADPDERNISIYLLALAGTSARPLLTQVSKSPLPNFKDLNNPHSIGALKHQRERSLRATGLAALDHLAIQNPQEVSLDLQKILIHQNDDTLKFFAQMSLIGIAQGKPGKLSRWLQKNVNYSEEKSNL